MNPELLAKIEKLVNPEQFKGIKKLIKDNTPGKIQKSDSDKRYEQMRGWKRSMDLDNSEGKQTVGPSFFKGSPAKDMRLAQIDRRNQAVDKAEDDILNSPEIQELIRMTQAYKDREKVTMPLYKSGEKFTSMAHKFGDDRSQLFNEAMKECDNTRANLFVELKNLPKPLDMDSPAVKDLQRRFAENEAKQDAINEQWKIDQKDPRIHPEWYNRFTMMNTPEGKYFDTIDYDYGLPKDVRQRAIDEFKKVPTASIPSGNDMPSPQKYLRRFHTTKIKNMPSIFKEGLDPAYSGTGFGDKLSQYVDDASYDGVYTIAEEPWLNVKRGAAYHPGFDEVTLELQIPKDKYKMLGRLKDNVEDEIVGVDKGLQTVQNGGRTDIFTEKLSPEFIVNAYDHKGRPVDFNLLRNNKDIKPMIEKFYGEYYKD